LDIEDPIPVNFLTVRAGTRFVFRVLNGGRTSDSIDCIEPILESALAELGIGAKTALGYGLMRADGVVAVAGFRNDE
jgi:CRISPR type III-B/RAMP module RAMP protein Cmr6